MGMNRRKFFAFLGAAPAVAVIGAKAFTEADAQSLLKGYVGSYSGVTIHDPGHQHTLTTYELPSHTHTFTGGAGGSYAPTAVGGNGGGNWTREELARYHRPQYASIIRNDGGRA